VVIRLHPALPVFRLDEAGQTVLYAPGVALATTSAVAAEVERAFRESRPTLPDGEAARVAAILEERGEAAARAWRRLAESPFEPECLTLYPSNRCNLACSYCWAAPPGPRRGRERVRRGSAGNLRPDFPTLSEQVVYAAARLVARNCANRNRPLALVLHGGGEPTLHWGLLRRVRDRIGRIARDRGTTVWAYIATHGVLHETRARWLAARFDLIGLSCDGPPEIQNLNRPSAGGAPTAAIVERTARVLADAGTPFIVRSTVTREHVTRQRDIVSYACDRLGVRTVRFEPVYGARRVPSAGFQAEHADEFVEHFLAARTEAVRRGCDLQISGVRLDEIHGPYCNPLRQVLQLTADGVAAACFLSTGAGGPEEAVMALGRVNPSTGDFDIDRERAQELRRRAARLPARCEACANIYHCARDCPDVCVVTAEPEVEQIEGFRCRVHKILAQHRIRELARVTEESRHG
jgi:uncharacterized protein